MSHANPIFSTLAVNYNNGYIDKSFYSSAIDQTNLKYMDYYHSRVMHNPQYSETFIRDYLDLTHPRLKNLVSPVLEDDIETVGFSTGETGGDTVVGAKLVFSSTARSIKQISQDNQVKLESLISSFILKIKDSEQYSDLMYMLACYVFWANVRVDNQELKPFIESINSFKCFTYNQLYEHIHLSTWRGGKLKQMFISLMKEVVEEEE